MEKAMEKEHMQDYTQTAIFAAGCFWGVEYQMKKAKGVVSAQAGYTGGGVCSPSYKQVCAGDTGHIEAIKITFDTRLTDFETLAKLFFEIHDFTQTDGQGPDIGYQYLSRVFYTTQEQKETAEKLIKILEEKGYKVATKPEPAQTFWAAEDYHQNYYEKKGAEPYCHAYKKVF